MPTQRRRPRQKRHHLNGYKEKQHGWTLIRIWGNAADRGYAYGYLCASEFAEIQRMLAFLMPEAYGQEWSWFVREIYRDFGHLTQHEFREMYEEMRGIAAGCTAAGTQTTVEEILAWNFYLSIPYWYSIKSDSHFSKEGGGWVGGAGITQGHFDMNAKAHRKKMERGRTPDKYRASAAADAWRIRWRTSGAPDRCSAFMAIGHDWTKDGGLVCAHNSFTDYIDGQYSNVVLDVRPSRGYRFVMQTSPCWIWSGTDFFITSRGIVGTETTIGGFVPYEMKWPIGYRIRRAMQYGRSLDDYCRILLRENSGDYANSWLFADIREKEILRLELGLRFHSISRTKNGFFIGFNATYDERIRNLEVVNSGFYDIRRHQGARMVRLGELMQQYKGRLTVDVAKTIISDHYDVYLKRENNPCSRTVCAHYDLDAREYMSQSDRPKPFAPHGTVDGIVCDSEMAAQLTFWGRFGNSCGQDFDAHAYCREHRQYEKFCPYLHDRPSQPWTILPRLHRDRPTAEHRTRHRRRRSRGNLY